jgi:hypothetical protein
VYGEIVGYVSPQTQIQKSYDYKCEPGTYKFYVYKVTSVNQDGDTLYYTDKQIQVQL